MKEINNIDENPNRKNISKLMFLIPVINLAYSLAMTKAMNENLDNFIKQGIIIPLTKTEQKSYDEDPSMDNALNFSSDEQFETEKTVNFIDENGCLNEIHYIMQGDIPVVKDCKGPISEKNKLSQRAKLLQILQEPEHFMQVTILKKHKDGNTRRYSINYTIKDGELIKSSEFPEELSDEEQEEEQEISNLINTCYYIIKKEYPELDDEQIVRIIGAILTNSIEQSKPKQTGKQFVKRSSKNRGNGEE